MALIRRILPKRLSTHFYPIFDCRVSSSDGRFLTARGVVSSARCPCPSPVRRNASSTNTLFSNPSAVVSVLRAYGFSHPQISSLANRGATFFLLSADAAILPKLKFFASIGLSNVQLQKLVSRLPCVLSTSLQDQLIPCLEFLRGVPLDDKQITGVLNWWPRILFSNLKAVLIPNIRYLKENGVSQSSITSLVLRFTPTLGRDHEKFKTFFHRAVALGLHPSSSKFVEALHIAASLSKDKWESKVNLFRRFGLEDNDFAFVFRKQPTTMGLSEENIERRLEFFINELSWSPAMFARNPRVLISSFEMKVRPRCQVMEILVEKGLSRKLSPTTFLVLSEKKFLERYIHGNKEVMPELLDLYCTAKHSSSSKKADG